MLSLILQQQSPNDRDKVEFEETNSKTVARVPYISKEDAEKLERRLSEAWNRLDARTYWRMNAAINGGSSECKDKKDKTLGVWDNKEAELKQSEFCDGNVPQNPVPWAPQTCPAVWIDFGELTKRYTQVLTHAATQYHKDYMNEVEKALDDHAPNALLWSGHQAPGMGRTIIPVQKKNGQSDWSKLTNSQDSTYYRQALPGMQELRRELSKRTEGRIDPPGIQSLEQAKKDITNRSSIFPQGKTYYWAGQNGGPKPSGDAGLAPSKDYEVYGVLPTLQLKAEIISEGTPRGMVNFKVACLSPTWGVPVPLIITIPVQKPPMIRVTTEWVALVEGYEVPDVKGIPRVRGGK